MKHFFLLFFILNILQADSDAQCFSDQNSVSGSGSFTTGNSNLDKKINQSKRSAENLFAVTAEIEVITQSGSDKIIVQPYDGHLYHGKILLDYTFVIREILKPDNRNILCDYVISHGIAHILQIKKQLREDDETDELMADYLSGYFLGRENYTSDSLEILFRLLPDLQKNIFCCEQNYPSSKKRTKAILAGYEASSIDTSRIVETGFDFIIAMSLAEEESVSGVVCPKCKGEGKEQITTACYLCNAGGKVTCRQCSGTGGHFETTTDSNGKSYQWFNACSMCAGTKTQMCEPCNGTGTVSSLQTCDKCKGSGKLRHN
jgi:hypothetical protein